MAPAQFQRVLIANRGEPVVRIARSLRQMGLHSVAVYSQADAGAPFVNSCDVALAIGGHHASESYLRGERLIEAALRAKADAIHPGYGFLAENPDFAAAVQQAGLVWIGPSPEAMRAMADKAAARGLMQQQQVPVLPGSAASVELSFLRQEAARLGLPLMLKAAAGGGGRGMRLVRQFSELEPALSSAMSEAKAAFGDGRLLLERALLAPRHVEIQLMADASGRVLHLAERDCTVQRRHQKLIEEAPSPAVNPALRRQLGAAAISAAQAVGYVGVGTVEFLLDTAEGGFYFMEMNTRLQVEHAVTEALLGLDIVQWQIRLARGESLAELDQHQLLERFEHSGHAMEARLCAEDPELDHLPQSGTLWHWQAPDGVRCDAALASGCDISPLYDSLLAKLIAHGPDRASASAQLALALEQTECLGVMTNAEHLAAVVRHELFQSGQFSTSLLQHLALEPAPQQHLLALAAVLLASVPRGAAIPPPWQQWRLGGGYQRQVLLLWRGQRQCWQLQRQGSSWQARCGEEVHQLQLQTSADKLWRGVVNHQPLRVKWLWQGDILWLHSGTHSLSVQDVSLEAASRLSSDALSELRSPMHGRVVAIEVEPDQPVQAGQLLLVIEAMKMEHHLKAPCSGVVKHMALSLGQQVASGQKLLEVEARP